MPFYELVNGVPTFKEDVTFTQLRDAPDGMNQGKTYFENSSEFWYAMDATAAPLPFETVTAQMVTDLASVPRFMWGVVASYGRHTIPAMLHDRGCDVAGGMGSGRYRLRRHVDRRFRHNLASSAQMGFLTRWMMWAAVRLFGVRLIAFLTVTALICGYVAAAEGIWGAWTIPWTSTQLEGRWLQTACLIAAALLLVAVLMVSWEVEQLTGPAQAPRHFRLAAFSSMAGAIVVGAVSALPLAPVISVTAATNLVVGVVNYLVWRLVRSVVSLVINVAGAFGAQVAIPGPLAAFADQSEPPSFSLFPGP